MTTDRHRSFPLGYGRQSSSVLERTLFWTPPVEDWKPLKETRNSSLRIACLVEERLYDGLQFEGEVLVLTPDNWRDVLSYGKPDFLLVESIWISSTGHWHMAQTPASPEYAELVSLVNYARELGVPTVFWQTKGHEHHQQYQHFAVKFDMVCCTEQVEIERFSADGIQAELVLPCVQPALYNPFRPYNSNHDCRLDILYDGWADLDRLGKELDILKHLIPLGLNVIESRYKIFRSRLDVVAAYRENVLGCVTKQARVVSLKYAKAYATLESTLSTSTTQQWMSLEAAASRVPVVHNGKFREDDVRKDFVIACADETEFLVEFHRFQEDVIYRERRAQMAWRLVNQKHTFAHRIQQICKLLELPHDWEEYPKVSLISPSYRLDRLKDCLNTFEIQSYPNKELILVINASDSKESVTRELIGSSNDIVIEQVPSDMFAGTALNVGALNATGSYYFRIDDDDCYGRNYVLDAVLQARSVDAVLFGKPPVPVKLENSDTVFTREIFKPFSIISMKDLTAGHLWFGGNSLAGESRVFQEYRYFDDVYGSADSAFMLGLSEHDIGTLAFGDPFNLVAERRDDLSTHTWKVDFSRFVKEPSQRYLLSDLIV